MTLRFRTLAEHWWTFLTLTIIVFAALLVFGPGPARRAIRERHVNTIASLLSMTVDDRQ